jgi:hypothetical protein
MRLIGNIELDRMNQLLRPQEGDDAAVKSFKRAVSAVLTAQWMANPDKVRGDLEHSGWQFENQG